MVQVRLMGTLREAAGQSEVDLENCENISTVINGLVELFGDRFVEVMFDPILNSPLPNALILLNGVEVNNLQGLETHVNRDDSLVLLSVTHGG